MVLNIDKILSSFWGIVSYIRNMILLGLTTATNPTQLKKQGPLGLRFLERRSLPPKRSRILDILILGGRCCDTLPGG